jgi:hypothetical protein
MGNASPKASLELARRRWCPPFRVSLFLGSHEALILDVVTSAATIFRKLRCNSMAAPCERDVGVRGNSASNCIVPAKAGAKFEAGVDESHKMTVNSR